MLDTIVVLSTSRGKGTTEYQAALSRYQKKYGSAAIGYVEETAYEDAWSEMGLMCPYEQCIENQPLLDKRDKDSCGIFGHQCPDINKCPNKVKKLETHLDLVYARKFVNALASFFAEHVNETVQEALFELLKEKVYEIRLRNSPRE